MDERSRYSRTSESKKQIKVLSTLEKDKISLGWRKVRNEVKQKINTTKTLFCKKILNSKNTKDIWKVIHDILNAKRKTLEGNVNDINKFFNCTAAHVAGKEPVKTSDIYHTITLLPENNTTEQFELQTANSNEVLKIIKSLRNDCSTGYDNIPIFLIKSVAEYILSPQGFIINNQILTRAFSKNWKISRNVQFQK